MNSNYVYIVLVFSQAFLNLHVYGPQNINKMNKDSYILLLLIQFFT